MFQPEPWQRRGMVPRGAPALVNLKSKRRREHQTNATAIFAAYDARTRRETIHAGQCVLVQRVAAQTTPPPRQNGRPPQHAHRYRQR